MTYAKEYHREYMRNWARKNRAEFMAGKSCVKCGSTQSLEVDHIDPSEKVTHRIWSGGKAFREAELAKCQVLCAECHKEKTQQQRGLFPCGTGAAYKRGCRCEECREAKRIERAASKARLERKAAA
ncbi:5-methylcytosine-specific restriction endonuclease McrA [Neomicrococcus aestuarii]|uniref:5-methylcytosine-specific restriction endonuclease McrA n=1 Tax=Neomicrococcus aestuarii TaxID=556325 RepID=A0A7W8TV24_9MICC|nr:HNH endonuclease signature motif containing protein [Neomicrococcus aestuarii]MBB5513429.1 5-methylcytosine-specific restriction endonuclease McrA [Neomicrococcus aestuarii]